MTPKEQYEARKAERKKLDAMDYQLRQRTEQGMLLDTFDRFVTAAERIADALERGYSPLSERHRQRLSELNEIVMKQST